MKKKIEPEIDGGQNLKCCDWNHFKIQIMYKSRIIPHQTRVMVDRKINVCVCVYTGKHFSQF